MGSYGNTSMPKSLTSNRQNLEKKKKKKRKKKTRKCYNYNETFSGRNYSYQQTNIKVHFRLSLKTKVRIVT